MTLQLNYSRKTPVANIILLIIIGIIIFATWYNETTYLFWGTIENAIFYYFNRLAIRYHNFADFLAIINNRAFDGIALIAMCSVYFAYYNKQNRNAKLQLICMGIFMLICGVILKQIGGYLPIVRESPSVTFPDVVRVSHLTSIPTKDSSANSFPGDHGLMLMVFTAFMCRYFGRRAFWIGVLFVIIFTLPRIMIGAHWFTDIYVGSLSLALIILSWLLLTPLSDIIIMAMFTLLPNKWKLKEG